MSDVNLCVVSGRITRDIEIRYTPNGTEVVTLGIATNEYYKKDGERIEKVTFVDVELWGQPARFANEYLGKGRKVLIEGRLALDQWEDKDTGKKRSRLKLTGKSITPLDSSRAGTANAGADQTESDLSGDDVPF